MKYPDLTSFGHDPWWLVVAKALFVFVFLLLTVSFGSWRLAALVFASLPSGDSRRALAEVPKRSSFPSRWPRFWSTGKSATAAIASFFF